MENNNIVQDLVRDLEVYAGFYREEDLLKKSASGGASAVIAENILKKDGVVFGVAYTSDYKSAEYIYIDSMDDLELIKGSKYIPAKKNVHFNGKEIHVFEVVKYMLMKGKVVLFIGLGCDVAALYFYLKRNDVDFSNLYTLDLICHGPTNAIVQEKFVSELEEKYKSKVTSFTLRNKKQGWVPPYIVAEFDNGEQYECSFYESEFAYAFGIYSKKSCYSCKFKGKEHKADITIGDYWGLTEEMEGYNKNGVSVFLVRSIKGKELISMIKESDFFLYETNGEFVIENNPMYYMCREKNPQWDEFDMLINKKGLHKAVVYTTGWYKYYMNYTKRNVKTLLKRLLGK